MCDSNVSKVKLPAFCRLCPGQAGSERIEESQQGLDQQGRVQSVSFLPNVILYPSVEQSTEESNVIYAQSRPLKDAFPQRGGQVEDVAQSCTFLYVKLLSVEP